MPLGLRSHFNIVTQNCPERCWAASIAGIFGYNDHPIDQDVIAQTVFRTLACLPSETREYLMQFSTTNGQITMALNLRPKLLVSTIH